MIGEELRGIPQDAFVRKEKEKIDEAMADDTAMFILGQLIEDEGLDLDDLHSEMIHIQNEYTGITTEPRGWISLARLWRADLIDIYGEHVSPTNRGFQVIDTVFEAAKSAAGISESTT